MTPTTIENAGQLGLEAEARKHDTFEEFEKAWLFQLKHGLYWHVTDNPNFTIDPQRGPRDMSSMAAGRETPGKLMITSHLSYWAANYKNRGYAALIDMSAVPKNEYYQVNRGFGNEFFVNAPEKARVIAVLPIKKALEVYEQWGTSKPQSEQELREFYERVHQNDQLKSFQQPLKPAMSNVGWLKRAMKKDFYNK